MDATWRNKKAPRLIPQLEAEAKFGDTFRLRGVLREIEEVAEHTHQGEYDTSGSCGPCLASDALYRVAVDPELIRHDLAESEARIAQLEAKLQAVREWAEERHEMNDLLMMYGQAKRRVLIILDQKEPRT